MLIFEAEIEKHQQRIETHESLIKSYREDAIVFQALLEGRIENPGIPKPRIKDRVNDATMMIPYYEQQIREAQKAIDALETARKAVA